MRGKALILATLIAMSSFSVGVAETVTTLTESGSAGRTGVTEVSSDADAIKEFYRRFSQVLGDGKKYKGEITILPTAETREADNINDWHYGADIHAEWKYDGEEWEGDSNATYVDMGVDEEGRFVRYYYKKGEFQNKNKTMKGLIYTQSGQQDEFHAIKGTVFYEPYGTPHIRGPHTPKGDEYTVEFVGNGSISDTNNQQTYLLHGRKENVQGYLAGFEGYYTVENGVVSGEFLVNNRENRTAGVVKVEYSADQPNWFIDLKRIDNAMKNGEIHIPSKSTENDELFDNIGTMQETRQAASKNIDEKLEEIRKSAHRNNK